MIAVDPVAARRRALWNARCQCCGPLSLCECIDRCDTCQHLRIDHDYDGAPDAGRRWGCCDVPDCQCSRFEVDDE